MAPGANTNDSAKHDLQRPDVELRDRGSGIPVVMQSFGELRHATQIGKINTVANLSNAERVLLYPKFEKIVYVPQGDAQTTNACLFNLIIAFEWQPSYSELEQFRNTFDQAASLLFDATDGYMALNCIIVGGPELMQCADIQIFPSNRLYPRAWVNGLHIERKYQPIRVGRGYWRKNSRRADPWHKNLGAAVLVHEWLHYALGLKDRYVQLTTDGYAIPTSSAAVNTLMANLESSELLEQGEWRDIRDNPYVNQHNWLQIPADHVVEYIPPHEIPTVAFAPIGSAAAGAGDPQIWLEWKKANLTDLIDPEHCWVYLLLDDGQQDPPNPLGKPHQLFAQGSYEALPEGYRIIGVRPGACLILIGHKPGKPSEPVVLYTSITDTSQTTLRIRYDQWEHATPSGTAAQLPWVAVSTQQIQPAYNLAVDLTDPLGGRTWQKTVFPLGTQSALASDPVTGMFPNVPVLDGHVVCVSDSKKPEIVIAHYSIGGSPGAAYPGGSNPVPAGSSDGNAMVFFYSEHAAAIDPNVSSNDIDDTPPYAIRLITTTNVLGPATSLTNPNSAIGEGPRSYTFAITTNQSIASDEDLHPTLVLYFDSQSKKDTPATTLITYRLNNGTWEQIAPQREFLETPPEFLTNGEDPGILNLVATGLNAKSAPGLFQDPPIPEVFRLFLV